MSSLINAVTRGPGEFMAVGFDGSKYVIVGENGTILSLVPGVTIEAPMSGTSMHLGAIAYGNGKFVATGQLSTVTTSSDGVTWVSQTLPDTGGAYIYDVTYGDKFVAVGQYGKVWTSLDGESWMEQISNTTQYLQAVTYSNGLYVAAGSGGTIAISPDGVTWTVQTLRGQSFAGINYGNDRFVVVGSGGRIASSSNGIQWNLNTSGVNAYLTDIAYGNNTFVVVGNNVNLTFRNSEVTYDGNGYTGGIVPTDSGSYAIGTPAAVLSKGNMVRTGYIFTGWNTSANGSGTRYAADATITMDMDNVTLYAQWTASLTNTVTYNGNGNTGGTVPVDNGTYETGAPVSVQENTGNLVKVGYTFADVGAHWSEGYIAVLERENIALGDNGYFHPNEPVTRSQFVAFLSRIIQLQK